MSLGAAQASVDESCADAKSRESMGEPSAGDSAEISKPIIARHMMGKEFVG